MGDCVFCFFLLLPFIFLTLLVSAFFQSVLIISLFFLAIIFVVFFLIPTDPCWVLKILFALQFTTLNQIHTSIHFISHILTISLFFSPMVFHFLNFFFFCRGVIKFKGSKNTTHCKPHNFKFFFCVEALGNIFNVPVTLKSLLSFCNSVQYVLLNFCQFQNLMLFKEKRGQ